MITLRHEGLIAEIAPEHGAAILSLAKGGRDILRRAPSVEAVAEDPRAAACFPCIPWFGRLYGGLNFAGRHWDLWPTLPACDAKHALHGEAWVRPWGVIAHTDMFLECRFSHDGFHDGRFPFAYDARQIVQFVGASFRIDLILRNIGREPMPAGLGLHPYFSRSRDTRIDFAASDLWTPSPDGGALSPIPADFEFSGGARLPNSTLDHSYAGFAGAVEIGGPGGPVRLETDAPILHVYAPAGKDYFCLEPVTHLPGDFGAVALRPGESLRLMLAIACAQP
ncbi:MAG: hypothetical protein WD076_00635 [Parvularculaceae bacterium]